MSGSVWKANIERKFRSSNTPYRYKWLTNENSLMKLPDIVELTGSLKKITSDVSILNITARNDQHDRKITAVNHEF